MIQVDGITRRFGSQIVLRELSWRLLRGSRVGLVGPNGAGKTTLLRILAGRDEPDAGAVHSTGTVRVGYLPQEVETVEGDTVLGAVLAGNVEARDLERRLADLETRMAAFADGDAELAEATRLYGELRHRFEAIGGDAQEVRARSILTGLGIAPGDVHRPIRELSGGWRMRVVLARLLLLEPDLLLLDEPTNHLDLPTIDWLERFLDGFPGAFVVVSHDRYFLNRMVQSIAELDHHRILTYAGNYDAYVEAVEVREASAERAQRQQARKLAQTERFIERFRYKNTKAKQVQSRIKSLEKVERIETRKDAAGIRFGFAEAPRSGDIVVRAEEVTRRFGSVVVYDGLDLTLRRGDRMALVGPNGAGKSTLLKLIGGVLEPDGGRLELGHNVLVQYYAQHQLEALDPSRTVLQELETVVAPGERQRLRNLLGRFLFRGEDVDKPVAVLSGGEKARLALAKLLIHPANLLLLDEPTNHLDLKSREMLEDALAEYAGTLMVISHDRYFINRVADHVGEVGGGRLRSYPGDYDTYLEQHRADEPEPDPRDERSPLAPDRQSERTAKRDEAEARNTRYRARKAVLDRMAPVEREIEELEGRLQVLADRQADPVVYTDPEAARDAARDRDAAESRLHALYAEWDRLGADLPD